MNKNVTVVIQPKTKKQARIASHFPTVTKNNETHNVIRAPPKSSLKSPHLSNSLTYSPTIPRIVIPRRKVSGYIDIANEVRIQKSI